MIEADGAWTKKVKQAKAEADAIFHKKLVRNRRIDAIRSVLQLTDRILTGRTTLTLRVIEPDWSLEDNPAWTDGETIFLNKTMLQEQIDSPKVSITDLVKVMIGTNYHEVGHILFSPRNGDPLPVALRDTMTQSNDNGYWQSYMMLEDQRIETLYTGLYWPTTGYFVAAVLKWLCSDTSAMADVFPLVYGRKFLPVNVRMQCRIAFVVKHGEATARQVERIIDSYLPILLPRDNMKAHRLIVEFHKLVSHLARTMPHGSGCGTNKADGTGRTRNSQQNVIRKGRAYQSELKEAIEVLGDTLAQDEQDKKDWQKEQEGQGCKAKGEKDQEGDGDAGNDDGEGQEGENDNNSVPIPGRHAGEGREGDMDTDLAGTGIGYDPTDINLSDAIEAALNEAQKALEESEKDEAIKQDIAETVKSIKATTDREGSVTGNYGKHELSVAPGPVLDSARRVFKQLQEIKFDLEPIWIRQQATGRINSNRAMRHLLDPAVLDIFDQWDEGAEEEASIEVVILLDLSTSMRAIIRECSEALWALKRSFDRMEIRTTVIGFSDGHVILFKPDEKVQQGQVAYFDVFGGTNPDSALQQAHGVLNRSTANNLLLIAITDGAWAGDSRKQESIIKDLRKKGAVTCLFGIGYYSEWALKDSHGMEVVKQIDTVRELSVVVQNIITSLLKRLQHR